MTERPIAAVIRAARPADAPELAAFAESVFVATFGQMNTAGNMETYVRDSFSIERVRAEIADQQSCVLIAEQDGAIVGYARIAETASDEATPQGIELVRLYVAPLHQGRGVADALTQACIDEARSRGHASMWLGVWEHNPRAQAFYARWGFARTGQHEFMLGDDRQTDWIMERAIGPDTVAGGR